MAKRNSDNLRIKRKYLVWLQQAKGLSEASVDKAAAAISSYEAHIKGADFRQFHSERAVSFKRGLASRKTARGAVLASSSINGILREVRAFMCWLADQAGYRSRIRHADASYFSPDRKSEQARHGSLWKPHPSPEQVRHAISAMPKETVLQRRDRALMAFLCLTGSRETAAMTVRLGHVDLQNGCVNFDGRLVSTKYGKRFTVSFFPAGLDMITILEDWISELRSEHFWSTTDPLFPKTRMAVGPTGGFAAVGLERAPWKSPGPIVKLFKAAFVNIGLPPFSPHRIRDMLVDLAQLHCATPEEFKAWSQNMAHEDVLVTFRSYGSVATGRQMELLRRMRDKT